MFELVTDPDLNELSIIQVCNSVEHVGGVNASLLVIDEDEELDPEYEPVPSLLVDPPDELEVFTDLTWDDVLSLDLTIFKLLFIQYGYQQFASSMNYSFQ